MKIDRSRLKKSTSEVPLECQALIDQLRSCTHKELLEVLKRIDTWTFGKCELYHWIDILDMCDAILEEAATRVEPSSWTLACDLPQNSEDKELLLWVLHFTTLLIEHSFSRHLYNSMEHLITLLSSCDMNVVLGVLNLLYMFSKRSNFITRLNNEKQALLSRLTHLAESWGGKENGFGLADCCKDEAWHFPPSSTTLHFEYYSEVHDCTSKKGKGKYSNVVTTIHVENVDKLNKTPAAIMNELLEQYSVPTDKQMQLFTHIRLAYCFSNRRLRLLCVQARLQALSVLVYSNALAENAHTLLYSGILEELVELLEMTNPNLVEIRAAALRALTSIIHLDRNPHIPKKPGSRLNMIIDVTGAASYHGFLPVLVRTCILHLTSPPVDLKNGVFPLPLATALFSFLYHLASYEAGGEALVSCGMMESLLKVINWPGPEYEHLTFVTRAVRVIDLITNIDMQTFQTHGGLNSFINRLEMEVNVCRVEQPFEITFPHNEAPAAAASSAPSSSPPHLEDEASSVQNSVVSPMDVSVSVPTPQESNSSNSDTDMPSVAVASTSSVVSLPSTSTARLNPPLVLPDYSAARTGKTCLPQRAALLKSMLNFLKKAIQDPAFSDSIRHVMEGSLPSSLKHIISNAEYYGPSLFLLATDVVTVYVFQEPSLLSSLQDNGLTDVVLHALLVKDVPATREVLGSLPNVFSALCLNTRGLASFVRCDPFDRLFKVLLSPVYLAAMRRRRSSDPMGDTASNLGNAMDELMRHQPSLKVDATYAIIKLLEELCVLGRDPKYVCWRAQNKLDVSPAPAPRPSGNNEGGSSDEEDEDEEEASTSSHPQREETATETSALSEKKPIALIDYIVNVMKFVDAILSNNSTDDHCREFVGQDGLVPLLSILGLPNLPVDYPVTPAAQSVASVCKSILNLAHEPQVLKQGLIQLSQVLEQLKPLHVKAPGSSVLLHELASAPNLETAFTSAAATPLLHAMGAAHGYVVMFVHVCRTGQSDIRTLSLTHWGSDLGLNVLNALAELYTSLVWESTLLLALCSDDIIPPGCKFGREDMEKLLPPELRFSAEGDSEPMDTNNTETMMDVDGEGSSSTEKSNGNRLLPTALQLKYIKPLLGTSSRLGRALAELFGLLVKLCVGSPIRARRGQQVPNTPALPTPAARSVATALNILLANGLNWTRLPDTTIPKFKLTFLICSVGFTSPMLFDEKKYPYHLMLQKFVNLGGQSAFFETFRWALSNGFKVDIHEGLEHEDLTDGTGEFLDAWLMLLEKMVNPKAILDSPHTITAKQATGYKPFDPMKYLMTIHKLAFDSVMLMWGKKPLKSYGARMSESMLAILRHILRGEKIIAERMSKEKEGTATQGEASNSSSIASTSASSSGAAAGSQRRGPTENTDQDVNGEWLLQLMDMGFSREHCVEALLHAPTVEQATDYLLSNPSPLVCTAQNVSLDVDLTEEDQMLRAIAMSLGEKIAMSVGEKIAGDNSQKDSPSKLKQKEESETQTLSKEAIDGFTNTALPACLTLIDTLPDTVYRVCDLLITISKRNGENWRDEMLTALMAEISMKSKYLLRVLNEGRNTNMEVVNELINSSAASKLAGRIHLFTLLFEEMRIPCAQVIQRSRILPAIVKLLVIGSGALQSIGEPMTPKWLAPLLLLIDLLEKVAVCSKRREKMYKVTNRIWRWFDITTGKWTTYSSANNKLINDAYWSGESMIRVNCGRHRYVVHFGNMSQVNEETANRRLVTMSLVIREKAEGKEFAPKEKNYEKEKVVRVETEEEKRLQQEREKKKNVVIEGLDSEDTGMIVRACVGLMSIPVDRDALHAVMRVCLRLTRNFENASIFASMGGVRLLLDLTQASSFTGFLSLSTLLIRHVMEEPKTLRHAMEKVLRSRTLPNIPPPYKEILYLLRNSPPVVTRDPRIFLDVAKSALRVDLNILSKRNEDEDIRLLVKTLPMRNTAPMSTQEGVSTAVVYDLLNYLIRPPPLEESCAASTTSNGNGSSDESNDVQNEHSSSSNIGGASASTAGSSIALGLVGHAQRGSTAVQQSLRQELLRNSSSNDLLHQEVDDRTQELELKKVKDDNKTNEEEKKRPLLPKSAILKILAEAVRSYPVCARLITEHSYLAGQTDMITQDCSALAFLLDRLLPGTDCAADRECQTMARMLIAALASCNHTPDAQTALVTEVKAALGRALGQPESADKHAHIQLLAGLISTMIDHCPSTPNNVPPNNSLKLHQYGSHMNNMVRIMLRKGILTDLARVSHYLDLSSPNMAASVNAALKPLETLSRIVNQPTATSSKVGKQKLQGSVSEEPAGDQTGRDTLTGTSTSEATHAQGEETVEDAENTEHDISAAAESLEPTSESQVQDPVGDEAALEDIMDQLLDRDIVSREDNVLNASFNMETEEQNHTVENSRTTGRSQPSPSFDAEMDDTQDADPVESDDSDSDTNPSEEIPNVEDDDEDEDGDNDDEEGNASGYDDDGFEFLEHNEGLVRIPAFDRNNEDILMISYTDPDQSGSGPIVPWTTSSLPLPFGIFEDPANVNDNAATHHVPPNHPLLMARHNLEVGNLTGSRAQRSNRPRRYQYLQLNTRNPNPPVILQRLLGSAAHDLPPSATQALASSFRDTRVVVMDNGLGILTNSEEEQIDFVDQSGYLFGPSLAATLNNIPTALHWWTEECKLLDGDSTPDCVTDVVHQLVPHLEKLRDEELAERREKRRKQQEEEEAKKRKTDEEGKKSDIDDIEESAMEVVIDGNEGGSSSSGNTATNSASNGVGATASATENLAHVIVDSVLRPVMSQNGSSVTNPPSATENLNSQEQNDDDDDDQEMDDAPVEVRAAPDFSGLATGLLSSLSEILPSVAAPQRTRATLDASASQETESGASYESSYPNSASSLDSNQLGSLLAQNCNTATPQPQPSYESSYPNSTSSLDSNQLGSLLAQNCNTSTPALATSSDREDPVVINLEDYDSDEGPPPLVPISSVQRRCRASRRPPLIDLEANMEITQEEDEEQDDDDDDDDEEDNPRSYSDARLMEGIHRVRHAPRNLQEALEMISYPSSRSENIDVVGFESNGRLINGVEDLCDIPGVTLRDLVDLPVRHSADGSESIDLEAAEAWIRTQIEARMSQVQVNPDDDIIELPPPPDNSETPNEEQPGPSFENNANASNSEDAPVAGPSSGAPAASNSELPEGVDPSFLAALPDEMREEVIAEQLRLQRLRQRAQQQSAEAAPPSITEVNPEFLAALPPAIQEEVLAQQRLEQQRQAAAAANPNDPVDAAAFFQNLQPSLRQAILTDMEDSQISVLPPDLAQEAQNLRREWEARNRQLVQERLFGHVSHSNSALSSILRSSGTGNSRVGTTRYAIHTVPQRAQWGTWGSRQEGHPTLNALASGNLRPRGKQLLDYESMSCLLVLLFVDEPKLNTGRLHRVLRNLCYHAATREWVIKALLSIMEKCNDCRSCDSVGMQKPRRMSTRLQPNPDSSIRNSQPSWLNISLDAALGCRASVFTIMRSPGKRTKNSDPRNINIHSQAAPIVFRHTLEVLISLAKSFPGYFLPLKNKDDGKYKDPSCSTDSRAKLSPGSSSSSGSRATFWDMLLRLDSTRTRKGKSVAHAHSVSESEGHALTFDSSAFGQLLTMLASPVVKKSTLLTDKLLRLLSLISIGLPEVNPYLRRREGSAPKKSDDKDESMPVSEQHLKLAIDVLTSKSCSEEGLEDATALLLNLANCPDPTRDMILHLLLDGAMELANMVNDHIGALLQELKSMNRALKRDQSEDGHPLDRPPKGVVHDRFTKDSVIVTAPTKVKTSCDLQLPSMATLTSKTSSQAFFLRILKVIVQIRESVRLAHKRNRENSESLDYFQQGDSSADEGAAAADDTAPGSGMDSATTGNDTTPGPSMDSTNTGTANSSRHATSNPGGDFDIRRYVPCHRATRRHPRPPRRGEEVEVNHAAEANRTAEPNRTADANPTAEANHAATAGNASTTVRTSAPSSDPLDTDSDAETPGPPGPQKEKETDDEPVLPPLSEQLTLDELWDTLSRCLLELADTPDHHAVLVLQPAVEAFFLVHATAAEEHRLATDGDEGTRNVQENHRETAAPPEVAIIQPDVAPVSPFPADSDGNASQQPYLNFNWEVPPSPVALPPDQQKFLRFAETHRTVLNQILRQSTTHLADGPFAVLVDHTRVLDFDVKRRYFRSELERMDEGIRREELAVHVRRSHVFEDSFRELHRRTADEWKNRFYIVFEGEEGQDAGGLLREWYVIISREIFNPMYALFTTSPGDRVTYMINSSSHCNPNHLCYFKFVGRVIAKAIYDNKLLECYFTRSFYKHILGILVKYTDMESEDYSFYQGLVYLMEHHVSDLGYDLTFSAEVQEFGVTDIRDLIPNGRNIQVCEQNKMDYIRLVCQMKMTGAIRKQINAFLEGFYDIIPKRLISIFNEQELELLISGLPNVDIEDLRANTEYHKYQPTSLQIQWFWRALRSFDQAARAKFLQFVTGTSKVPLQGFGALEGMNGVQKFQIHRDDRSTDRLPSAHTCFNQLDLPVYETYDKLRTYLLKAIHECSEGFGFA